MLKCAGQPPGSWGVSDLFSRKQIILRGIAQSQQSRNVEERRPRGGGHLGLMATRLFSAVLFMPRGKACFQSLLIHGWGQLEGHCGLSKPQRVHFESRQSLQQSMDGSPNMFPLDRPSLSICCMHTMYPVLGNNHQGTAPALKLLTGCCPHGHERERIWTKERTEGRRVPDGYSRRT